MSKKMFWGLGALIILLISAGGFIFWQLSEMQQLKEEAAAAEKILEEEKKPEVTAETPTDFTKPPPGKTFEGGGHWHNGEWHDAPHTNTVEAGAQHASFEPDDTWRLYPDNVWRKKGEQPIPNTVPLDMKLPEDVFSDAYTEGVKKLVQAYVEYRRAGNIIRSLRIRGEIQEVRNVMSKLWNIYYSDKENNRYAWERREELSKLLEPYLEAIPRPERRNHPSPLEKLRDLQEKYGGLPSKADLDAIQQSRQQRRNNQ